MFYHELKHELMCLLSILQEIGEKYQSCSEDAKSQKYIPCMRKEEITDLAGI